ncbi:MAG: hypothetical protein V8R88_00235 [Faecalibacterium prausnitzii]
MWVYQQTGTPAHLPEAAQPLPTGEAALLPQPQKTLPPERSAPEVPSPLQRHNTETRQKTCWLLVCAFLIGSGSAGVLLAFCEKQQPDWLQYYLQSWRGLFAAADAHTAASLFGMEYLTLAAAATLLFLMGFSALGPVLIFLFTMFYGLGNGTLFVQLLSDTALKKRNVASAACISACGSCFCRAVHARHRFSAGEQPDPRLFLFCSRA